MCYELNTRIHPLTTRVEATVFAFWTTPFQVVDKILEKHLHN